MELFKIMGTIAIDNGQANRALDETAGKADGASKKTESGFAKIGKAALSVGKAVITAGGALGGAWLAAIEGSREYRTEMGKLDTAFVTNGHSSADATKTYQALQSVLGDTDVSVEAANHLAVMTTNEKDLGTWTDICTGVYATFGASLPIEGLTEAANETAKVGEVTGPLADALNWAGISEDDFNDKLANCSGEQARQKLIMETLNKTYSKASEQYKETNKDVIAANQAQEKLNGAMAELGRVGEPILTMIKTKVAEFVTAAIPYLESFIQKVKDLGGKIKDLKKWVEENKNAIDGWTAVIIATTVTVAAFMTIMKWGTVMSAAAKAITKVRTAMVVFNATLLANPIGLIISIIAGLVAAFIYLWNTNEGFRNFWIKMWDKIKEVTKSIVDWCKKKLKEFKQSVADVRQRFEEIKKAIADKMNNAKEKVRSIVDAIKQKFNDFKAAVSNVKQRFEDMKQGIANKMNSAKEKVRSVVESIKQKFNDFRAAVASVKQRFEDMKQGIKDKINAAKDAVKTAVEKIKGFFKFKWSLPKLKIPTFTLKGEFSLKKMTVPTIGIKWNAAGGVMTRPTIFGSTGNTLLGGGEAGPEAIAPIYVLQSYVRDAVRAENAGVRQTIIEQNRLMMDFLRRIIPQDIMLDSGALVGQLTPAVDMRLGERWAHGMRGNTR